MFLYDINNKKPLTPNITDITSFKYNNKLKTKIALGIQKIANYKLEFYIDLNGNVVSDLYNSYSKEFVDTSGSKFSLLEYINIVEKNIKHEVKENSDLEIKKKLRKKLYKRDI